MIHRMLNFKITVKLAVLYYSFVLIHCFYVKRKRVQNGMRSRNDSSKAFGAFILGIDKASIFRCHLFLVLL